MTLAMAATFRFHPMLAYGGARQRRFDARLALAALVFLSPLCALSSARIAHHMYLVAAVAPLLVAALPAPSGSATGTRLVLAALLASATIWFWHAPAVYAAALSNDKLYRLMKLTLLGSALFAWRELCRSDAPLRTAVGNVVLPMGLLGALIACAPVPLHALPIVAAPLYGLTPLEDQQLAGLIMWVPAILLNLPAALVCLNRFLSVNDTQRIVSAV